MTEFIPESMKLLERIKVANGGAIVDGLNVREMRYEDVEKLLTAKPSDLAGLPITQCPNLLSSDIDFSCHPESIDYSCSPDDLKEIQAAMADALNILRSAESGEMPRSNIADFTLDSLGEWGNIAAERAHELMSGPYADVQCPIAKQLTDIDTNDEVVRVGIHWKVGISASGYADFLEKAAHKTPGWSAHWERASRDGQEYGCLYLSLIPSALFPDTAGGRKSACKWAFDQIATLHMADIRTVSVDGGKEWRTSDTGLSMAWWLLLDRLRIGRVGVCEECGMPFITNNERGNPRRFCSKRCQMRAVRRKKGQTPPNGGLDSKGDAETGKEEQKE